jgi:hypothetical protein
VSVECGDGIGVSEGVGRKVEVEVGSIEVGKLGLVGGADVFVCVGMSGTGVVLTVQAEKRRIAAPRRTDDLLFILNLS